MSYGFHRHPLFQLIGSADAEIGKPSTGNGKLQCNSTYSLNIGLEPTIADLSEVPPEKLREVLGIGKDVSVDVLSACPPCTGFSRQKPKNHIIDDKRNSLVRKSALFAVALDASIVVMENARELIRGNFRDHYEWYREYLENHGYDVFGKSYMLTRFGLPQIRERAIIIAVKSSRPLYTLESLWDGWHVKNDALNVRHAFNRISDEATETETYPKFSSDAVKRRLAAIPKNGGSWIDLYKKGQFDLLTDSMKRTMNNGRVGSYPDVYGRMAWDKPAPTIKRECSHVGNGRYAHPSKSRLCSVREMAILQGFPNDFKFESTAVSNMYRHIGDAVPPLISYQIAHLCEWMLTGKQPHPKEIVLPGTSLTPECIHQPSADLVNV